MDRSSAIEEAISALRTDAAAGDLLAPGRATLAIAGDGSAVLWSSPEAAVLAAALSVDRAGTLDPSLPAGPRLRALAQGLAPVGTVRLEKLRFESGALARIATCACTRMALPSGDHVLVLSFVGPVPQLARRARAAARPAQEHKPEPKPEPKPGPAAEAVAQASPAAEVPAMPAPQAEQSPQDTGVQVQAPTAEAPAEAASAPPQAMQPEEPSATGESPPSQADSQVEAAPAAAAEASQDKAGAEPASEGAAETQVADAQVAEAQVADAQVAEAQTAPAASAPADDAAGASDPVATASSRAPQAPAEPVAEAAPEASQPQDPLQRLQGRGTVRFLWEADAEGRVTAVSPDLADVVGPDSGGIVGLRLDEIIGDRALDPLDIVLELVARRETWSQRRVMWRIDGTDHGVAVDLAGLPVFAPDRTLRGLRGFGLCRTDTILPLPPRAGAEAEPAAAAAPEDAAPTAAVAPSIESPSAAEPDAPTVAPETPQTETGATDAVSEGARTEPEAPRAEAPGEGLPDTASTTAHAPAPTTGEGEHDAAAAPPKAAAHTDAADAGAAASDTSGAGLAAGEPEATAAAQTVKEAAQEAPIAEDVAREEVAEEPAVPAAEAPAAAAEPPAPAPDEPPRARSLGTMGGRVSASFGGTQPLSFAAEEPRRQADGSASEAALPLNEARGNATTVPAPSEASDAPALARAISSLSPAERNAFREIARALGARIEGEDEGSAETRDMPVQERGPHEEVPPGAAAASDEPAQGGTANDSASEDGASSAQPLSSTREPPRLHAVARNDAAPIFDRLPVGILVHRGETALFVNRYLLDLTGYDSADAIMAEGGLGRLFRGRPDLFEPAPYEAPGPLMITTRTGETVAVEIKLNVTSWDGEPAGLMTVRRLFDADPAARLKALELEVRRRDSRLSEYEAILDTATDGVIVLDDLGRILSLNRSAEALFGYEQNEVTGEPLTALLATESHVTALDYLDGLRRNGVASLLNDGREVLGRVRQGGAIPLFMTLGRVSEGTERKFCAVLRDITAFKKAEGELVAAKRAAERANAQKSDFLAKISHEIRTPLNAIIGFAEVMLEERFGPVANERYRDYIKDVHASGQHVISLVNDLLDLAKIEAGRMELSFTSVSLNELVASCVSLLQPQASRERIVMRTSFATKLPPVIADERALRQIVINLVSNAVKFTDAGGQVIVSTARTDRGEVVLRVRDTGIGMSENEVEAALEPFRQLATARKGGGTGLGLPLTRALVEANRGTLQITSARNEGTLVEVVFPAARVLAD